MKPLIYGPTQRVVIDPAFLGTEEFRWPTDPRLVSDLHWDLYRAVFRHTAGEGRFAATCLLLRFKIIIVIANWIAEQILIDNATSSPSVGIRIAPAKPVDLRSVSTLYVVPAATKLQSLRWRVAYYVQRAALRVIDWLRLERPLITIADEQIEASIRYGWIWRIRAPYLLAGARARLSQAERDEVAAMARRFADDVNEIARKRGLVQSANERAYMIDFIESELLATGRDYQFLMRTLGRRPFVFVGGSMTIYVAGLVALVARDSGGEAHGTVHGGCTFATWHQGSALIEVLIASTWWCPSARSLDSLQRLIKREQISERAARLIVTDRNPYEPMMRRISPKRSISHVAVMSVGSPLQVTNCGSIPVPIYFDFEARVIGALRALGVYVTYKAHPEDTWGGYRELFGGDVGVEYRRLPDVVDQYDGFVFLNACTSAFIDCLTSDAAVFLFDDGWHNFWDSKSFSVLRDRCEIIPASIERNGSIQFDKNALAKSLKAPKVFDDRSLISFYGIDSFSCDRDLTVNRE